MRLAQLIGMRQATYAALPLDARIWMAAGPLLSMRYGKPTCPYDTPPQSFKRGTEINCSSMTWAILSTVYPSAGWTSQDYQDIQVWDGERKWSPIESVNSRGVGVQVVSPLAGRWHLVQGWRSSGGGHAFLVYGYDDGRLGVLQSTSRGKAGPVYTVEANSWIADQYDAGFRLAVLR
jgi:hypothetical protein